MFGDEPDLEFIGAENLAYEKVIGALVAGVGSLVGQFARLGDADFDCDDRKVFYFPYFAAACAIPEPPLARS